MITRFWGEGENAVVFDFGGEIQTFYPVCPNCPYRGAWDISYMTPDECQSLRVHAAFDGCWSFGVGMTLEDLSFPEGWNYKFVTSPGGPEDPPLYSIVLTMDVPDGASLEEAW